MLGMRTIVCVDGTGARAVAFALVDAGAAGGSKLGALCVLHGVDRGGFEAVFCRGWLALWAGTKREGP